jgi:hypothetical protein
MPSKPIFADARFRVPVTVLIDVALVGGSATVLWNSGGTTVINGSWLQQMFCIVLAGACIAVRQGLGAAHRNAGHGVASSLRAERLIAISDVFILAATIGAWVLTQRYYIGWLATFGALALVLASGYQFLSARIAAPTKRPLDGSGQRMSVRLASLPSLRVMTGAAGLGALIGTAEIHEWNLDIITGLIVLLTGAIILGLVTQAWIMAVTVGPHDAPPPRSPVPPRFPTSR